MHVHFVSIGGSVMHQLALALKQKGYTVTGSDDEIFEPSRSILEANGLLPAQMGWNADRVTSQVDAVLLGMHARQDNPELQKALSLSLPVYSFPEYIYRESLHKTRVVVGGSHGKTTTTSMIMHVLARAGLAFDYLVGARIPGFAQSVSLSDAPVLVCEGDEYPASALERKPKFHFLFPHIAVITGIAWDHINVFPTFESYLDQFRIFLDKIEPGGVLVYNSTDEILTKLVAENLRTDITRVAYGLPAHEVSEGITFLHLGNTKAALRIFGRHNLLNVQAALHVCRLLGVSDDVFANAMADFEGAARRLEVLAQSTDRVVYRDFAHAPSKVKATIEAVKQHYASRHLTAVLELHTFSSLNASFLPHYAGTLNSADSACVYFSPHAVALKRLPMLDAKAIREGFERNGLHICTSPDQLNEWVAAHQNRGGNLLLMSSGSFDGWDASKAAQNWVKVV